MKTFWRTAFLAVLFLATACNQPNGEETLTSETQENHSEIAIGALAGSLRMGSGSMGAGIQGSGGKLCPFYVPGSRCEGNTYFARYDNCSFPGSSATWKGGERLMFGGGATCGKESFPLLINGQSITRRYAKHTQRTLSNGRTMKVDTETKVGFSTPVSGGSTITALGSASYSIVVHGIHVSTKQFDFSASTGNPLIASLTNGTRSIISGSLIVQDNNHRILAMSTITQPLVHTASCCTPTSGQIQTQFTKGKTGTEVLTLTGCGTATLVNSEGASKEVTLRHCF